MCLSSALFKSSSLYTSRRFVYRPSLISNAAASASFVSDTASSHSPSSVTV
ncbi:hypothetical protein OBV_17460 [Oscillibacter valericigenes Sjm18-20]|nr:hypothetical protein OBV_17460 [Oscillibacter valericigenes Sjm18-20]